MDSLYLQSITRSVLLTESSSTGFWDKSGNKRILSFPKMKQYFLSLGVKGDTLDLLERRLHTMSDETLKRHDSLIVSESAKQGVNPALIKAMGLLESKLGNVMNGEGTQAGFIHMTRATYKPYFPEGTSDKEMARVMSSPEESLPICIAHVKHLIEKFKTPELVIFAVKNGEYKISKETKGEENPEAKKKSMIADSDYTQASLALRKLFAKDGPMPVGGDY